jgi:hypothetical protein
MQETVSAAMLEEEGRIGTEGEGAAQQAGKEGGSSAKAEEVAEAKEAEAKAKEEAEEAREVQVQTVLVECPQHLILTLKRMTYDTHSNRVVKLVQPVTFGATIKLPGVPEDLREVVGSNIEVVGSNIEGGSAVDGRYYGLYAVVVHRGQSATAGHYFSYGRRSGARDLWCNDSPSSPWVKFNDTNVTGASWASIQKCVKTTVAESAYLLFYRKLTTQEVALWRRTRQAGIQKQQDTAAGPASAATDDMIVDGMVVDGGEGGDVSDDEEAEEAAMLAQVQYKCLAAMQLHTLHTLVYAHAHCLAQPHGNSLAY